MSDHDRDRDRVLTAWRDVAAQLPWAEPPDAVFAASGPRGAWFPGGRLNVAAACVDRHLPERRDAVAFHWEGEPEDRRTLTYGDLDREVRRFAAVLTALGIRPRDRVGVYMGLIPEAVVAMLACARIGAVHAVLPAVLPPDAVEQRLADVGARVVVTQDGAWRHGAILPLKARLDEAVAAVPSVEHTVVVRRTGVDVDWYEGDRWYHDLVEAVVPGTEEPEPFGAEHPLLVTHVANRRRGPAGIVHGSANFLAYLLGVHLALFRARDAAFWLAAEIAWQAGQSHAVYGPLVCGGTSVLYEGMLDTPTHARAWEIVERYGVGVLATTPSILRSLRAWSASDAREHDLRSLGRVVSAGEPLDPELRAWVRDRVPAGVDLVDGWGQTELGGVIAASDARGGAGGLDPGLDVVDDGGRPLPPGSVGELVLRHPWPGTFVAIEGGDIASMRCLTRYPGAYATGDRARRTPDGALAFLGRIDPVTSVAGQLVSLTEVEDTLLDHPHVLRAVVAAGRDARTSNAVVALVQPADGADRQRLAAELGRHVQETLGGLSRPRTVVFASALPGLPDADLRRAVRAVCAVHSTAATLEVTEAELRALSAAPPG
ncbi:MAG TPA: AMP-binding protein [Solirubrobacteraceae bacterium]|jgi:acetyl-CoA synthetase|nr:AMP-binding protein [Solirubrobacteraceae bacterium]